jgi:hypothetical protein
VQGLFHYSVCDDVDVGFYCDYLCSRLWTVHR